MSDKVQDLYEKIKVQCQTIAAANITTKEILANYSDGKNLKGDELVGWLGEIYAKIISDGKVIDTDDLDYDVIAGEKRISVKARKGTKKGWNRSSNIPATKGEKDDPTHLMFLHLNEDYSLSGAWEFDWNWLQDNDRLKPKKNVFYFALSLSGDEGHRVYPIKDRG